MLRVKMGRMVIVAFSVGLLMCCTTLLAQAQEPSIRIERIGGIVTNLDLHWCGDVASAYAPKVAIWDGLVQYKPGTFKEIEPALAVSWELSEDKKVITFHLREGVTFQQGFGPFTAQDVKASFDRFVGLEAEKWSLPDIELWEPIDRVEVVDDYTVKLIFKHPDATFLPEILPSPYAHVTAKKAIEKYNTVEGMKAHAVGTGPYYVDHWTPLQELVLLRFEDYWGPKPYYKKVTFISVSDIRTGELALERGELDIARISMDDIERYRGKPDIGVNVFPSTEYRWIGMNMRRKPFDDIRVRMAIRYAVNVDEILEGALAGVPKPTGTPVAPGLFGCWEEAPIYNKPDLEKARQLLTEAGYPDGFTATIISSVADVGDKILPIVQAQLAQIGIDLKITILEKSAVYSTLMDPEHPYDMFVVKYSVGKTTVLALQWFVCEQVGKWNLMNWCNPIYDDLLKAARGTFDLEARKTFFVLMQKVLDQAAVGIFIDNGTNIWGTRKGIELAVRPDGTLVVEALGYKE